MTERWIADLDDMVMTERQSDGSYTPAYKLSPITSEPPDVSKISDLLKRRDRGDEIAGYEAFALIVRHWPKLQDCFASIERVLKLIDAEKYENDVVTVAAVRRAVNGHG